MKKRRWNKFYKMIVVVIILGSLLLHFYIPRFITEIRNPIIEFVRGNGSNTDLQTFEKQTRKGKHISFKSFDGIELSSYLTYSSLDTVKGTLILLHGIRSNKECYIELSKKLSLLGYHSVSLDSRGHGASEGVHCTFGVKEKKDVSELIDALKKEENISENIGVWGRSLGGAIGIQALGYDQRIKYGIIESTFSDFKTITHDYLHYHTSLNYLFVSNYLANRAGKIAGFNPIEAKPSAYCKKISQPVLLVHGDKDDKIDISYAKENFNNLASKEKSFIEITGANHLNVWEIGGEKYFNTAMAFINQHSQMANTISD